MHVELPRRATPLQFYFICMHTAPRSVVCIQFPGQLCMWVSDGLCAYLVSVVCRQIIKRMRTQLSDQLHAYSFQMHAKAAQAAACWVDMLVV